MRGDELEHTAGVGRRELTQRPPDALRRKYSRSPMEGSMTSAGSFRSVACLLRSCARIAVRRFHTLSDRAQPRSVFVGCGRAASIVPMARPATPST